jgi:hypothetical protein
MISPLRGETTDEFHTFAEKLMFNAFLPFAKTNFNMMSAQKRHLLNQELHGVAPSSRRITLSSKSEIRGVIGRTGVGQIE